MEYRICVNLPGCLPDSETYPYRVGDLTGAVDALGYEFDAFDPEGETEQFAQLYTESVALLQRGENVLVNLKGYNLSMERVS